MSMISIKNFISPFRNTVHAVTIVLITVLFALFRLQGGGVSATYTKTRPVAPIDTQIILPETDSLLDEVETQIKIPEKTNRAPSNAPQVKIPENPKSGTIKIGGEDTDLIEEFIDKKSLTEAKKPAPIKKEDSQAGGLDDIEKSLGMR